MTILKTTLFLFLSLNAVSSTYDNYYSVEGLESDGFTDNKMENLRLAVSSPMFKSWNTEEGKKYAAELKYYSKKKNKRDILDYIKTPEEWVKDRNVLLDIARLVNHGFVGPNGRDNLSHLLNNKIKTSDSEICQEYKQHLLSNQDKFYSIDSLRKDKFTDNNNENLNMVKQVYSNYPRQTDRENLWETREGHLYSQYLFNMSQKNSFERALDPQNWIKKENSDTLKQILKNRGFNGKTGAENWKRYNKRNIYVDDSELCKAYVSYLESLKQTPSKMETVDEWLPKYQRMNDLIENMETFSTETVFKSSPSRS